jgi:hypothetical protein
MSGIRTRNCSGDRYWYVPFVVSTSRGSVARSLVFFLVLCRSLVVLLFFCPFSIGHCVVCTFSIGHCVVCAFSIGHCVVCTSSISHCIVCLSSIGHCVVCTSSISHCVVCTSSIYRFWLPHWYLQILLILFSVPMNSVFYCDILARQFELFEILAEVTCKEEIWGQITWCVYNTQKVVPLKGSE